MPPGSMQETSVVAGLTPQQMLQVQAQSQFSGAPVMNGNPQMVTAGGRVMGMSTAEPCFLKFHQSATLTRF